MAPKLHLLLIYRAFDIEHVTYCNEGDISALMSQGILVLVQLRVCGFPDRLTSVDSLRSFLTSVNSLRSFLTSVDSNSRLLYYFIKEINVMYITQSRAYSVFLL